MWNKWTNKTGKSVKVTGYEFVFGGKVFTRTPGAAGGTFEAKAGETWKSTEYLFEGMEGVDASSVNVIYQRWVGATAQWSSVSYRAKLSPGHPTCRDGKVYQGLELKRSDNVVGG